MSTDNPEIYVEEYYKDSKKVKEKFVYCGEHEEAISLIEYNQELASGNSILEFVRDMLKNKVFTEPIIQNRDKLEIDISQSNKNKFIIIRRGLTNSELEELVKTMTIPKESNKK